MQSRSSRCGDIQVWFTRMTCGYKLFFLITVICMVVGQVVDGWKESMVFNVQLIVEEYQFWRLFSSILLVYEWIPIAFLVTLYCLWVSYMCMTSLEKRYSTIYVFLQLFKQTFVLNLFICIVFYPLIWLDWIPGQEIYGGGPIYTMLILLFMDCCTDSNGKYLLCGIQFFLSKKYMPVLFLLVCLALFRVNFFMLGFIILLLIYQFGCRKKPILALPVRFYLKFDRKIPMFIRNLRGWIDAQSVKDNLSSLCSQACQSEQNQRDDMMNSEVVVDRKDIKPTGQAQYKHHWINKQVPQPQEKPEQIEEQPKLVQKNDIQILPEVQQPKIQNYQDVWKSKDHQDPQQKLEDQDKQTPALIQPAQETGDEGFSENLLSSQYSPLKEPEQKKEQQYPQQERQTKQRPTGIVNNGVSVVVDDDQEWS